MNDTSSSTRDWRSVPSDTDVEASSSPLGIAIGFASGASTTSIGASRISSTRDHDTFAVVEARVEAHQRLRRREHAHLIGEKRAHRAERQRAVDDAEAAVEERDRRADRQHRAGQAAGEIGDALHAHQRLDEGAVEAAKPILLALLRVRRDDERRRLQRLDQEAADVGAALPQIGDAAFEPASGRYASATRLIGSGASAMIASRQSSHTIMTRLPIRNSTLPTQASAASAATR